MASQRIFEPMRGDSSSSGGSTAGANTEFESPNHPGHPDYISAQHDPYDVENPQFESVHGPLETVQTHQTQHNETRHFEAIHRVTSPRDRDVEVRPGDRAELARIASAGTLRRVQTTASSRRQSLGRRDTYADVGLNELDDPTMDPNNPEFVSGS